MTDKQRKFFEALKNLNTVIFISPEYQAVLETAEELEKDMKENHAPYCPVLFPPEISDQMDKAALEVTGRLWDRIQYAQKRREQKHTKIRVALGFLKPEER